MLTCTGNTNTQHQVDCNTWRSRADSADQNWADPETFDLFQKPIQFGPNDILMSLLLQGLESEKNHFWKHIFYFLFLKLLFYLAALSFVQCCLTFNLFLNWFNHLLSTAFFHPIEKLCTCILKKCKESFPLSLFTHSSVKHLKTYSLRSEVIF